MKTSYLALLASVTAVMAAPAPVPVGDMSLLEERQLGGSTSNELKTGPCKAVTFIMARGSTEQGNMGQIPGPPTCSGLKQQLGADQVACQGVGAEDGYAAALAPNFQPKNTDDQSIAAATKIMNMAMTKCPDSTIVVGGYSQGSAVVDNAIQGLPAASQAKIAGVALFGFTRNAQDNGQIPGYPKAQTTVFCAQGDLVCDNTLTITAAHLSYAANAPAAASFLAKMAKAAGTSGTGAAAAAAAGAAGATGATAATGAAGAATKATKSTKTKLFG